MVSNPASTEAATVAVISSEPSAERTGAKRQFGGWVIKDAEQPVEIGPVLDDARQTEERARRIVRLDGAAATDHPRRPG